MRISILLEALTGTFETDVKRASRNSERELKRFQQSAARIGRAVGTALAVAGTAFAGMIKHAADTADRMAKVSQQVGVTTEALSQLSHAANLSGSDAESLNTGLLRLSRVASDAASGMQTAERAFSKIGVEAKNTDGTLKGTQQLLLEVADKFSQYEDGAAKAAVAQELFGRAGAQLIPLLNQGRDGIEEMMHEADRLGLTIDTNTARAAEGFNDNLTRLQGAMTGLVRQSAARLLPTMEAITDRFVAATKDSDFLEVAVGGLERAFKSLVSVGLGVAAAFNAIGTILGATAAAIVQRDFSIIGQAFDDLRLRAVDQIEGIVGIWSNAVGDMESRAEAGGQRILKQLAFDDIPQKAKKAAKEVESAAERTIRALELQAAVLGMTESQAALYKLGLDQATEAQLRHADGLLRTIDGHGRLQDQMRQAEQVFENTRNPLERFNAEIERLNLLRDTFVNGAPLIDGETYRRAVETAQDALDASQKSVDIWAVNMEEMGRNAARNIHQSFADFLYRPFEDGLKGMLSGFIQMIHRMIVEAAAAQILGNLFTGMAGSGNAGLASIGGFFGGSRDSGGRGMPGQSYLIGTGAQPEMFIPDTAGEFIPASQQGGVTINQSLTVQAPEGRISRQSELQLRQALSSATAEGMRRAQ